MQRRGWTRGGRYSSERESCPWPRPGQNALWLVVLLSLLAAHLSRLGLGGRPCGLPLARAGRCLCRLDPLHPDENLPLHQMLERPRRAAAEGSPPAPAALRPAASPPRADWHLHGRGIPGGGFGGAGVLPPCRFCHPLPGQGGAQQPALPALPVFPGLRHLVQPQLPAGRGSSPHLEPAAERGPGGPADPLRLAGVASRLLHVRAALQGALLRPLPLPPRHLAWHPSAALQRPQGHLRGGRPGRHRPDQPGLPHYLGGRPLLDPADHLLHAPGHLHARRAAAEPHGADGLPDGLRPDGRPSDPADDGGPLAGHRQHPGVAGGRALVPGAGRSHAGGLQEAGLRGEIAPFSSQAAPASWRSAGSSNIPNSDGVLKRGRKLASSRGL